MHEPSGVSHAALWPPLTARLVGDGGGCEERTRASSPERSAEACEGGAAVAVAVSRRPSGSSAALPPMGSPASALESPRSTGRPGRVASTLGRDSPPWFDEVSASALHRLFLPKIPLAVGVDLGFRWVPDVAFLTDYANVLENGVPVMQNDPLGARFLREGEALSFLGREGAAHSTNFPTCTVFAVASEQPGSPALLYHSSDLGNLYDGDELVGLLESFEHQAGLKLFDPRVDLRVFFADEARHEVLEDDDPSFASSLTPILRAIHRVADGDLCEIDAICARMKAFAVDSTALVVVAPEALSKKILLLPSIGTMQEAICRRLDGRVEVGSHEDASAALLWLLQEMPLRHLPEVYQAQLVNLARDVLRTPMLFGDDVIEAAAMLSDAAPSPGYQAPQGGLYSSFSSAADDSDDAHNEPSFFSTSG